MLCLIEIKFTFTNLIYIFVKAYFSPLLHVWYLYCFKFGLNRDKSFEFVLFFAHQCNSTVTIVAAMKQLLLEKIESTCTRSIYLTLASICQQLRSTAIDKDVGSGEFNRHQPSSNKLLSGLQIKQIISSMNWHYGLGAQKLCNVNSQSKLVEELRIFGDLQHELITLIPGIGSLRSIHMILLSSLIGILPLELYVNVPMHLSGGPKRFLIEEMGFNNCKKDTSGNTLKARLLSWTSTEVSALQHLFTKEFTPNMFENAACMISRKKKKYDVYYYLPWYNYDSKTLTEDKMQLCFRVNGNRVNKWKLEAFDGKTVHCFINSNDPDKNIIKYERSDSMIAENGHRIEINGMKKVYSI